MMNFGNVCEQHVCTQSRLEYVRGELLASKGHKATRVRALESTLAPVQMRLLEQKEHFDLSRWGEQLMQSIQQQQERIRRGMRAWLLPAWRSTKCRKQRPPTIPNRAQRWRTRVANQEDGDNSLQSEA